MKKPVWISIVAVAVITIVGFIAYDTYQPGPYDTFAQCLTGKEVKMYGAFWCPHCRETKQDFGKSFTHIQYIECSTPNRQGQTAVCQEEGIEVYPTWEINGQRHSGKKPLEELSTLSGCELPQA